MGEGETRINEKVLDEFVRWAKSPEIDRANQLIKETEEKITEVKKRDTSGLNRGRKKG